MALTRILSNLVAAASGLRHSSVSRIRTISLGTPEDYARGKAALFPNEGGPAIVEIVVDDDLLALTDQILFPLSQGVAQFDRGTGVEELRATWPFLPKQIRAVQTP
jgi:hypothetical protein